MRLRRDREQGRVDRAPGRAHVIESIAVLPLENLSGDPAQDHFAEGMTDALISDLASVRALRVISRTSAMRYRGSRRSLPDIARELKVQVVVEVRCSTPATACASARSSSTPPPIGTCGRKATSGTSPTC